jgi:hypothetical protein
MLLALTAAAGDPCPAGRFKAEAEHYSICPPAGWNRVAANKAFTLGKWRAPSGYAALTVARRDSLWRDDKTSVSHADSWAAFDAIGRAAFDRKWERNDPTGNEYPEIHDVGKRMLGRTKALYVDYTLTNTAKHVSMRIRSYFLLRTHVWYSVSSATEAANPDLFLEEARGALGSFAFED